MNDQFLDWFCVASYTRIRPHTCLEYQILRGALSDNYTNTPIILTYTLRNKKVAFLEATFNQIFSLKINTTQATPNSAWSKINGTFTRITILCIRWSRIEDSTPIQFKATSFDIPLTFPRHWLNADVLDFKLFHIVMFFG
ncbi:MAG TPA: hypothetical protein DCS93_40980 [Microscillaceae bacterium]|nr:hypothetical protein [Microscillaceae bacterium]